MPTKGHGRIAKLTHRLRIFSRLSRFTRTTSEEVTNLRRPASFRITHSPDRPVRSFHYSQIPSDEECLRFLVKMQRNESQQSGERVKGFEGWIERAKGDADVPNVYATVSIVAPTCPVNPELKKKQKCDDLRDHAERLDEFNDEDDDGSSAAALPQSLAIEPPVEEERRQELMGQELPPLSERRSADLDIGPSSSAAAKGKLVLPSIRKECRVCHKLGIIDGRGLCRPCAHGWEAKRYQMYLQGQRPPPPIPKAMPPRSSSKTDGSSQVPFGQGPFRSWARNRAPPTVDYGQEGVEYDLLNPPKPPTPSLPPPPPPPKTLFREGKPSPSQWPNHIVERMSGQDTVLPKPNAKAEELEINDVRWPLQQPSGADSTSLADGASDAGSTKSHETLGGGLVPSARPRFVDRFQGQAGTRPARSLRGVIEDAGNGEVGGEDGQSTEFYGPENDIIDEYQ